MSNHDETTTSEIMEFLKENMVTKEDAKGLVTKEDAKAFATKEDLKGFATKDDLKDFATKIDLRKVQHEILDGVDKKLVNLKGDLIVMMRGEDQKVVGLIGLLKNKAVITDMEAKQLLTMEPFPQLI